MRNTALLALVHSCTVQTGTSGESAESGSGGAARIVKTHYGGRDLLRIDDSEKRGTKAGDTASTTDMACHLPDFIVHDDGIVQDVR